MVVIKLLTIIAVIASMAWFFTNPGFEPAIAIVVSLSALVSEFFIQKRITQRAQQNQSVSKSSVGLQAGGDINIGGGKGDDNAK